MTGNVLHLPLGTNVALPAREDRDWVTSHEVLADARISYRQLDYWTRTGLLEPLKHDPGSGHLRRYTDLQLRRAIVVRRLLHAGVSLQTIRQVVDEVTETGHVDIGEVTITLHSPSEAS